MEEFNKECLGQTIKSLRQHKKLSQAELGHYAGISAGYIGFIEKGVRSPSLEILLKLSRALGVRPYRLLQNEADLFSAATPDTWCEIRKLLEEITVRTELLHGLLDEIQTEPVKRN